MTVIVYEATNLVNGKRYIGVTKKPLLRRVQDPSICIYLEN